MAEDTRDYTYISDAFGDVNLEDELPTVEASFANFLNLLDREIDTQIEMGVLGPADYFTDKEGKAHYTSEYEDKLHSLWQEGGSPYIKAMAKQSRAYYGTGIGRDPDTLSIGSYDDPYLQMVEAGGHDYLRDKYFQNPLDEYIAELAHGHMKSRIGSWDEEADFEFKNRLEDRLYGDPGGGVFKDANKYGDLITTGTEGKYAIGSPYIVRKSDGEVLTLDEMAHLENIIAWRGEDYVNKNYEIDYEAVDHKTGLGYITGRMATNEFYAHEIEETKLREFLWKSTSEIEEVLDLEDKDNLFK